MRKITVICLFIIAGAIKGYSQSTYLAASDTRAVIDSVNAFKRKLTFEFKSRATVGVPGTGNFSGMLTLAPWADASGGKAHQMNFNDGGIFYRTGTYTPNQWEGWRRFIVEDVNGNVSIGTTDPKGYKLAVAGDMIAESVKVKLQAAWPDYVFRKDYELPSLEEAEKHIKEKGHLVGIPSEAEVKTNGIDLGEMNSKLLKKIEELTLYLIELKKENKQMSNSILSLNKKIEDIKDKKGGHRNL